MLQQGTNQVPNSGNRGRGSYFDKDALAQEIIALLTMDSRLRAGEIDRRCPGSPEQQAVSDTLRWMRRQGLVRMGAQKTWSLCDGVRCTAEARDAVILAGDKPPARVQIEPLKRRIIEALRIAFEQTTKKYMTHTDLVGQFVDGGEITKHAVSQALEQLVKEHKVVKYLNRIHDYMYHKPYFDQHPGLFDSVFWDTDGVISSAATKPVDQVQTDNPTAEIKVRSVGAAVNTPELPSESSGGCVEQVPIITNDLPVVESADRVVTDADDGEETESDRRRRKMRIRRRVLVAQTRIQVQVRRRHKVQED